MTMTIRLEGEYPFEVADHRLMYFMLPGKVPGTVLTIEQQIYTVRINQYTEPRFIECFWCYHNEIEARIALAFYIASDEYDEPRGWERAVSIDGGIRRKVVEVEDAPPQI